jgi:hypothetical protein
MKSIAAVLVLLLSIQSQAHMTKGTYLGINPVDQSVCSMEVLGQNFIDNQPHPLNERVQIKISEDTFNVGHPVVLDANAPQAGFNHDQFQGVVALKNGAKGLIVEMIHSETKEGPKAYTLITDIWTTGEVSKIQCDDLKLVKK